MINKKIMIIGGSIAGAAVLSTAIAVPIILTNSNSSSTEGIDEDKLPKITLIDIMTTSRNVEFTAKIDKNENYDIKKVTFYIKKKSNLNEIIFHDEKDVIADKVIHFETSNGEDDVDGVLEPNTDYVVYSSFTLEDGTTTNESLINDSEFKTLFGDPVSNIETFNVTSRDFEAKVKVNQPNEGPKIKKVSLKLVDSEGNDIEAGKMNDILFTEETTQFFDFNTVPDTGDDYIRRLESNSKYSLILTCEFTDGSMHKEKVGDDFITNESEEIEFSVVKEDFNANEDGYGYWELEYSFSFANDEFYNPKEIGWVGSYVFITIYDEDNNFIYYTNTSLGGNDTIYFTAMNWLFNENWEFEGEQNVISPFIKGKEYKFEFRYDDKGDDYYGTASEIENLNLIYSTTLIAE